MLTDADPEVLDAAVGAWLMTLAGFATPTAAGTDDCTPGRGALMQVRLEMRRYWYGDACSANSSA